MEKPDKSEGRDYATMNNLEAVRTRIVKDLQNGVILIPQVVPTTANFAGATNHAPNSDHSYSRAAATVIGTLPADAGDDNQQDYRYFRQLQGAPVDSTPNKFEVRAVGHSGYAADEGANAAIPDWERVNGWLRMGGIAEQWDVALQLTGKIVGPSQRWFFQWRLTSLTADLLPTNLEFYAGLWVRGAYEGWAKGDPFTLTYRIHGKAGTHNLNYRVLAKTDSGVSILSNVLNVPNAPDVLSDDDYPQIFFSAGPGFIQFTVVREDAGAYAEIAEIRNSIDLRCNDVGQPGKAVTAWPADPGNAPLAYAKSRNAIVGEYGRAWAIGRLTIAIPNTFNFSLVDNDGMFLRFGFTSPTTVDRQISTDQIMWSTQSGAWAPDVLKLSDGSDPIPTISPTSGNQGGNTGLGDPPGPGSGGGECILTRMPVLMRDRRTGYLLTARFKKFKLLTYNDRIPGEHREPYLIQEKKTGNVAEYYVLKTANGIRYECNARHELIRDIETRSIIQAQQVIAGVTKIACWVKGRRRKTLVISKTLVPKPAEVGTLSLYHPQGLSQNGRGMYVAGFSKDMDRGLFSSNIKRGAQE